MRRKVGDRVLINSKYFNPFNDMEGTIVAIDDFYYKFHVRLDDVHVEDGIRIFEKEELKKSKTLK